MHFYNLIKQLSDKEKISIFCDMDGVIASYDFGKPLDFIHKRPLKTNIETLRKVSTLPNVELFILSICRKDFQVEEKNNWLDINASFFKKENRNIISKEKIESLSSSQIKANFLKNIKTDNKMVLVDDDIRVLKEVDKELKNIIILQDSELVD